MKSKDIVQVKTFDGRVWNAEVIRVNSKSIRVKIKDEEWKGNPIILRKLNRDVVSHTPVTDEVVLEV